jgi:GNAT superfamily N-acetyltransferase
VNRDRVQVRATRDDDDLDALNAGSRLWMSQDLTRQVFSAAGDVPCAMLVAELDGVPSGTGVTLAAVSDDEASWTELADAYNRLLLDAPDSAHGADPAPYPVLRSFLSEPWQVMVARDGRQLVGLTSVAVRDAATRRLNTMFTGVERSHRGRGLATALKATHALALRNAGWRSITTQNMEGNEPILASNRKLGFQPGGGNLDLIYDHPASSTTGDGAG